MSKKYKIYTDGGARGNPGPAAAAFVIYDEDGKIVHQEGKFLGETTNNVAEYQALNLALGKILSIQKGADVDIFMDSQLIVRQMIGQYKIKEPTLKILANEIFHLLKSLQHYSFFHIPREQNKEADKIVNQVLDAV